MWRELLLWVLSAVKFSVLSFSATHLEEISSRTTLQLFIGGYVRRAVAVTSKSIFCTSQQFRLFELEFGFRSIVKIRHRLPSYRVRVKVISSESHLLNVIKYLQRADPELDVSQAITDAKDSDIEKSENTPILLLTVQEGPPQLSTVIPETTSEAKNMQRSPLRAGVGEKRRAEESGSQLADPSDRTAKKADVQTNLLAKRQCGEPARSYQRSERLQRLCQVEERLFTLDEEISCIKRTLIELVAGLPKSVDE